LSFRIDICHVQIKDGHLVLQSNFGNNKDALMIFGTEIKQKMLSLIFKYYPSHYFSGKKPYVKNLDRTITSVYPQQRSALSFIYIEITPSQGTENTAVADKFIFIWFAKVLRTCTPVITQIYFCLLILQ